MNIGEKLKELGIESTNYYNKKSFRCSDGICISCFPRELATDFYFAVNDALYKLPVRDLTEYEKDDYPDKYLVPKILWEELWNDKPYEELKDEPFSAMSLREYACIHLGVPETDKVWLNELIKKKK